MTLTLLHAKSIAMKKARYATFLFALLICIFQPSLAHNAERLDNHNRTLKAGVFNFAGYHDKDENGNLKGYGVDLLDLISGYSHLNFEPVGYEHSWADMIEMLKNGEIDIVTSARRTPEREKSFAFSIPVGRNHTILSKHIFNNKIQAGDYKTYDGMKVGAVAGSSQNSFMEDFAKDRGFSYTLIEFDSTDKLENALRSGEVDAILSSNLRKPQNETLLNIIRSGNFYAIARKEDEDIIDEINYALQQMNLNEGDWQNTIYYRHYGPDESAVPQFSRRESNFISSSALKDRKIAAVSRKDIEPYSYVEDGELKGILPDYFREAMKIARLPYELIIPEDQAHYEDLVKSGTIDVVLDKIAPDTGTGSLGGAGLTTEPYMVTGLAMVTRSDFHDTPHSIALPETPQLNLRPDLLKDKEVRQFSRPADALDAVRHGEADAAYVLPYAAQKYINNEPGSGLSFSMLDDNGAAFRMFVPASGDHELISILKKAMKRMPAGTLNQLGSRYTTFDPGEMSFYQFLYANPEIMIPGSLIIILGSSLLFIMWLRGRWNRRLLATTEHANNELASQLAIVEALSRDYENVLSIKADSGLTNVIKISDAKSDEKDEKQEKAYTQFLTDYIKDKVHPKDRKFVASALSLANIRRQLGLKDEFSGTYRVLDKDKVHYFQFTFVKPAGIGDEEENLILAGLRNIDDVIRREQEQKKALSEALEKSRSASAAKTTFLNNMSHDIRTPMNAIMGFTSLASANVENAPLVKRYLGKIMTSGNHLLNLINDVLDMSRIESGKVNIEEKVVALPEILHDLRTIAQADVKARNLDFRIEALDIRNEKILCDKLRLNQVLLNIISNAMKYTKAGGKVRLRVSQLASGNPDRANFEFRISDTGIGMNKEFLEHVFEPFERERTSTISGIQGTGLGLAITSKIVKMMGGTIEVESEVDRGSEFTVKLQFRLPEQKESRPALPHLVGASALVVDSDPESYQNISGLLGDLRIKPMWTPLAEEALIKAKLAKAQGAPFKIYMINAKLADKSGLELIKSLQPLLNPLTSVIMLTDNDWTDMESEYRRAGVTAFCTRPVFLSELEKALAAPKSHAVEEPQASNDDFSGKRVLLAEDNEMNQEIAQMILENAGFQLDIVENGQLAVDKIATMPASTYDLVLMDVQMPVLNGYDATRAIRNLEDSAKAGIPIIAMTANAFDEDREEAINAGMNGHVPKPIDIKKLMETLSEILK